MDWNVAAEQFPGAIEIVDIYHAKRAKQHLCDVAKVIYGPGADLADQWAKQPVEEVCSLSPAVQAAWR